MQQLQSISDGELVRLCLADGSTEQWEEFVRRYERPVAWSVLRTLQRWGASRDMLEDLVQEVFLKLCVDGGRLLRGIAEQGSESIQAFCRVIAANAVHDHLRAQHSEKRGGNALHHDITAPGIDSAAAVSVPADIERAILFSEIDRELQLFATERERCIFWLYYRQGLTAAAIARIPDFSLTPKGVESAIFRLTRTLKSRIEKNFTPEMRQLKTNSEGKPAPSAY